MEVHHHTHPAPGRTGKKWTHYFWEFSMLFLAVFCGFLAENIREHKVESHRAKVYAKNLYAELKKDTANIDTTMEHIQVLTARLDSFCIYSQQYPGTESITGKLYYYASFTPWVEFYTSDNTTINQLKNSGNLRLMPDNISQSINEYGKQLADLENEYALTKAEFLKIEELYFRIFDNNLIPELLNSAKRHSIRDSLLKLDVPLIESDPKIIKEYSSWLKFELNIYRDQSSDLLVPLKAKAVELLHFLNNKYHFE